MRNVLIGTFILGLFIASCGKDKDPAPPPPPKAVDTLRDWKRLTPNIGKDIADVCGIDRQTIIVSTSDGIYKSTDGAVTWTKRTTGVFYNLFLVNAQHIIAEGNIDFSYSLDGGNTWTTRARPSHPGMLDGFYTSVSTGYTYDNGLWKTTDTAKSWTKIYAPWTYGIYFSTPSNGWIFSRDAFHQTSDGGNTWQQKGSLVVGDPQVAGIQFTDALHGNFFADQTYARTDDGGLTWKRRSFSKVTDIHFVNNDVGYLSTTDEIFKTIDGGKSWDQSCKLASGRILDIYFIDAGTGWACGFDGLLLQLKL